MFYNCFPVRQSRSLELDFHNLPQSMNDVLLACDTVHLQYDGEFNTSSFFVNNFPKR